MYVNLPKEFIKQNFVIHLSRKKLGRKMKSMLWRIVKTIIYRLKSGCQWRELPIKSFFGKISYTWQSVYYHFNKWSKDGSWKKMWTKNLTAKKSKLDMSSIQLDGSHTPAKRGGEAVGYQKRKSSKTTNSLFLTDKSGIPLALSEPVSGNHHDLFEIKKSFQKILQDLKDAAINSNGLFMNADAGFDSIAFREICRGADIIANIDFNKRNSKNTDNQALLDDLLYKERFSVERTNAWIDAFKALLVRFETKTKNWMSLHYIAFTLIILRAK